MNKYISNTFNGLYETSFGQKLWAYLNENDSIIRMETASKLGKPALEAIDELLLSRFGEEIKEDRAKQMCGNMVRQVMESRGYKFAKSGVNIKKTILFTTASRYEKV